jgi:hypothetical protein
MSAMVKIQDGFWVNKENILFIRNHPAGFTQVTCNINASPNRFSNPEDYCWINIDKKYFETFITEVM